MNILREILCEEFLIAEDMSSDSVNIESAIKNLNPVRITYDGPSGEGRGEREIYPVAYGISSAGNLVVRAFQNDGDTSTDQPAWKLFRVDRITSWDIDQSKNFDPKQLSGFNDSGDEQMKTIYTVAPIGVGKEFGKEQQPQTEPEKEKIITQHPVNKGEVNNGGADEDTEKKYYSTYDIIQKDTETAMPKISPVQNKNIDNIAGQGYIPGEGTQPAPDSIPVKKAEIDGGKGLEIGASDGDDEAGLGGELGNEPANEPIEKDDINGDEKEPETLAESYLHGSLTLSTYFKSITSRMNNLWKN